MVRLIFLAVLLSCGVWGGLSAIAQEEKKPGVVISQPACSDKTVSEWSASIEAAFKAVGLQSVKVEIFTDQALVARANPYPPEIGVDMIILIADTADDTAPMIVGMGHGGKICGVAAVPAELVGKVRKMIVGAEI